MSDVTIGCHRVRSSISPNMLARQFEKPLPQPGLGQRHHLHLHPQGLVIPGGGAGLVFTQNRRLGNGA